MHNITTDFKNNDTVTSPINVPMRGLLDVETMDSFDLLVGKNLNTKRLVCKQ